MCHNLQSPGDFGDALPGNDGPIHILSPLIDFDVDLDLDTGAATGESEDNSAPLDLELDTESIVACDSFDDDALMSTPA